MVPQLKQYLADIGKRGGSSKSARKASAVRMNGAKGGRPRKDGMPPGSEPLEDVVRRIEASNLPDEAKFDLTLWAQQTALRFTNGQAQISREGIIKVAAMIGARPSAHYGGCQDERP